MGRHGSPPSRRRTGAIAIVAALAVGLAGWAGTRVLGGDDEPTPASSVDGREGEDGTGGGDAADRGGAAAEDRLAACTREVEDAEKVLDAAAGSARDWTLHVEAQTRHDDGEITRARSKKQWADSKSRGPGDIRRYDSAVRTARSSAGGCSDAERSGADLEGLDDCTTRLAAVGDAVAKGQVVHRQWVAHQKMMADQATMDTDSYLDKWHTMVEDAAKPLSDFDRAQKRASAAPACA